MPEQEEPGWPSADEDSIPGAGPDQGLSAPDGGATAQLPVPGRPRPDTGGGSTDRLAVPNVTPPRPDAETSWFRPTQAAPPQPQQQAPRQQPQQQRPLPPRPPQQPQQPQQRPPQRPDPRFDQPQGRPEDPRGGYQPPPDPRQQRPDQRRLPQIPPSPHALPMRIEPTGELRPAEATTGADHGVPRTRPVPPPPEPEHDAYDDAYEPEPVAETRPDEPEPPPPVKTKRKRRGLLVGGLVALLLVIALGVAAALPQVSNRLGLPWAPNAPKGDEPALAAVTTQLHGPQDSAPAPLAGSISSALQGPAGSSALGNLTGSVLDAATGTELWDRNAGTPLTPASTTKLLTVSAALLSLDHGLQLTTKVVQGAQPGTVILVAGGDITLNSLPAGKESIYPGSAHFSDLIAQVKKANPDVKKVQLDLSAFAGPTTAPGWAPDDAPSVSAANLVPIMLDGGRTDPTGNDVMRVANPAGAASKALAQGLGAQAAGTAKAPAGAAVLGEVKSAPLTELVDTLLTNSDNNLADAVGRQVAIAKGDEPSYAGTAKATTDVLKESGFDLTGVSLQDNSGLSTMNKIPAKVLSQILAVIAGPDGKDPRTAKLRPIIAGLPIAAVSGTLAPPRYTKSQSSAGAGWVRAKTGSLSNVNTLAGVVLDTDGRLLVFALMSSTPNPDPTPSRDALDTIAATLRGCGCR